MFGKWTKELLSQVVDRYESVEDALGACLLLMILFGTIVFYVRRHGAKKTKTSWANELEGSKAATNKNSSTKSSTGQPSQRSLRNVWDAARNNKPSTKEDTHGEKPFGSNYYYAHNNTNSKGGYADGLRMEDYTMNQPRLLSKKCAEVPGDGTKTNGNTEERKSEEANSIDAPKQSKGTMHKTTHSSTSTASLPGLRINKFQWDDPGDFYNGIGTIRIDTLPGKGSTFIAWKDVDIKNVNAKLADGGLLVIIETESSDRYHLHIRKLFGKVAEVKCQVKLKRLLVKLHKEKNRRKDIWDKTNLKAWPHP